MSAEGNDRVTLLVEVPICAFRPYESREYQDTHPFPPPSAVYGMLLSLCGVGRQDKVQHQGVRMSLAIEAFPERAKVFLKFRRGKELEDVRPDYQDVLIGIKLWVWLATGNDRADPPLVHRIHSAFDRSHELKRCGGLSLGESSYLVDSVCRRQPGADVLMEFLRPDPAGFHNLPVWIDHSANTNSRIRCKIENLRVAEALKVCWIEISPSAKRIA